MDTFGRASECIDKRISETYRDIPNPCRDESSSYENGLGGNVHRQSPHTGSSPIDRESSGPIFDPYERSGIENEQEFERYPEGGGGTRRWWWSKDIAVDAENPTLDPTLKPVQASEGINDRGNKWERQTYPDFTIRYDYDNRNGTRYTKYRDGTTKFDDPRRGITQFYPAPVPDEQNGHEEYARGEARDVSPGYPSTSSTSQRSKGK